MCKLSRAIRIVAVLGVISAATSAMGEVIVVGSSDFVGGVYDFHYVTWDNQVLVNGVLTTSGAFDGLFLTNSGNTGHQAWERVPGDGIWYLQAPGAYGGFGGGNNSTWNTFAAATMGFDFSSVTVPIASVEMMGSNLIFQFSPWGDEAYGDRVFAEVATPAAFGNGSYANLWEYTGNNPNNSSGVPGALGSGTLVDITGSVGESWLLDPALLEFRFGYELQDTDIPGRHLQLFRDSASAIGTEAWDGFRLRVTVVPEPSSISMLAGAAVIVFGIAHRRRRQKQTS